jgi:hypothetical protein
MYFNHTMSWWIVDALCLITRETSTNHRVDHAQIKKKKKINSSSLLISETISILLYFILYHKRQELFILPEHLSSPPVFCVVPVAPHFIFLCCGALLFVCLSSFCFLCTQCCQCLWGVHSWLPLWFSVTFMS